MSVPMSQTRPRPGRTCSRFYNLLQWPTAVLTVSQVTTRSVAVHAPICSDFFLFQDMGRFPVGTRNHHAHIQSVFHYVEFKKLLIMSPNRKWLGKWFKRLENFDISSPITLFSTCCFKAIFDCLTSWNELFVSSLWPSLNYPWCSHVLKWYKFVYTYLCFPKTYSLLHRGSAIKQIYKIAILDIEIAEYWESFLYHFPALSVDYQRPDYVHLVWTLNPFLHLSLFQSYINTLRHEQNGSHFADDIFKYLFLNEKFCILIQVSLKFCFCGSNWNFGLSSVGSGHECGPVLLPGFAIIW